MSRLRLRMLLKRSSHLGTSIGPQKGSNDNQAHRQLFRAHRDHEVHSAEAQSAIDVDETRTYWICGSLRSKDLADFASVEGGAAIGFLGLAEMLRDIPFASEIIVYGPYGLFCESLMREQIWDRVPAGTIILCCWAGQLIAKDAATDYRPIDEGPIIEVADMSSDLTELEDAATQLEHDEAVGLIDDDQHRNGVVTNRLPFASFRVDISDPSSSGGQWYIAASRVGVRCREIMSEIMADMKTDVLFHDHNTRALDFDFERVEKAGGLRRTWSAAQRMAQIASRPRTRSAVPGLAATST